MLGQEGPELHLADRRDPHRHRSGADGAEDPAEVGGGEDDPGVGGGLLEELEEGVGRLGARLLGMSRSAAPIRKSFRLPAAGVREARRRISWEVAMKWASSPSAVPQRGDFRRSSI